MMNNAANNHDNEDSIDSDSMSYYDHDELIEMDFRRKVNLLKKNSYLNSRFAISAKEWLESGNRTVIPNLTNEEWEEIGRNISINDSVKEVSIDYDVVTEEMVSFLFRGLTRSSTITDLALKNVGLSVEGVRYVLPFLQNASKLTKLELQNNNIQSDGFKSMLQALDKSPLEHLNCNSCGIEPLEIGHLPKHLKYLLLDDNNINSQGCQQLAKFLQETDSSLVGLSLKKNKIDDQGIKLLVEALRKNTSLEIVKLGGNTDISRKGKIMLLKLVNDISTVKATMESNHTLINISFHFDERHKMDDIERRIFWATSINNESETPPETIGRNKLIEMQLRSKTRAALAQLQEVNQSFYSQINPLHLPEVLSLVGREHGKDEFFRALRSSIVELVSTVDRKSCIEKQRAYHIAILARHTAKLRALDEMLAAMETQGHGGMSEIGSDSHNSKRRRIDTLESPASS